MFSSTVRAALIALAASAAAVSAAPGLSLKVSGPETVDGVDNLKVVTTLTNTGDETLKLLNDPRGALSKFPTNTFAITSDAGDRPSFTGYKVKYSLTEAAKSQNEQDITVLAPGQSVTVEHDLSYTYNFTTPGAGKYTFEAANLFHYVNSETNQPTEIRADVDAHVTSLKGKLAVARPSSSSLGKRATFVGCSSSQQSSLNSAASAAQTYAANAQSYLSSHTSSTTRYTTWFGTYTSARHSTVLDHFTKISGNTFSSYTYDCTCTDSGVYAYVNPGNFGYVTLCGAFWNAPNTGTDSRGGTLIHESSHFTRNGGTDDHVYGQAGAKALAQSNPAQAIDNADSHEYFAENNPALS